VQIYLKISTLNLIEIQVDDCLKSMSSETESYKSLRGVKPPAIFLGFDGTSRTHSWCLAVTFKDLFDVLEILENGGRRFL